MRLSKQRMSGSLPPASRLAKREPVLNSTDQTTPDPGKLFRIRTVSLLPGARDAPPFRRVRPRSRPARADAGGPGGSALAQGLLPPTGPGGAPARRVGQAKASSPRQARWLVGEVDTSHAVVRRALTA